MLIINFVCRDKELRKVALKTLTSVFPTLYTKDIEDEVNEIIYAFPEKMDTDSLKKFVENAQQQATVMNINIKKKSIDSEVDLCEVLETISLVDSIT